VVPAFEGTIGLKSRLLVRDREMMISGRGPVSPRWRRCGCRMSPLKIVVPGPTISAAQPRYYFQSHGVEARRRCWRWTRLIATLEFVARSDWVTIAAERNFDQRHRPRELIVQSIAEPELHAEFG